MSIEKGSPATRACIRVFVGGGTTYKGETRARDKWVVRECAQYLFKKAGEHVNIVTDGRQGVANDFIEAWHEAGGPFHTVHCLIALEMEKEFTQLYPHRQYMVAKTAQLCRETVPNVRGLRCALFIQGDEEESAQMAIFRARGIPVIAFCGSGGACAKFPDGLGSDRASICNTNPSSEPKECAAPLVSEILAIINQYLPADRK